MRRRKIEDDEMLITHKPAEPKDMSERAGSEQPAAAQRDVDPSVLAARLVATTDPDERKKLIADLQASVGNQEAERIIRTVRKSEEP